MSIGVHGTSGGILLNLDSAGRTTASDGQVHGSFDNAQTSLVLHLGMLVSCEQVSGIG